MKKRDLMKRIREIADTGGAELEFLREGGNHEMWSIGGERLVIPRHREINEYTARNIISKAKKATGQ